MNNIDPDILAALKTVAGDGGKSARVRAARKRHDAATQLRFETQLELLSDEVAALIPRSHPLFDLVLMLAVVRKVERTQAQQEAQREPEFIPDFEKGFNGW